MTLCDSTVSSQLQIEIKRLIYENRFEMLTVMREEIKKRNVNSVKEFIDGHKWLWRHRIAFQHTFRIHAEKFLVVIVAMNSVNSWKTVLHHIESIRFPYWSHYKLVRDFRLHDIPLWKFRVGSNVHRSSSSRLNRKNKLLLRCLIEWLMCNKDSQRGFLSNWALFCCLLADLCRDSIDCVMDRRWGGRVESMLHPKTQ